jgi:hypothetical protein
MQSKTREIAIHDANLEHVFPQNPDTSWGDPTALEPLTWHLGNLTILGTRLNRKAASADYATKAAKYYSQSEIRMTKDLIRTYPIWAPTEVLARARSLAPVILSLWKGPGAQNP